MNAIFSTALLVISLSFGLPAVAADLDEPLDDRALVSLAPNGLFVDAPTATNLVVMNVRVFDQDNQLVFRERSVGEPVNLLAIDLPDGEYSYEIVNVLDNSEEVRSGSDPNVDTEKSTHARGNLTIYGGQIIKGHLPGGKPLPLRPDEAWLPNRFSREAARLAMKVLDFLVPSAGAQDLTASSHDPRVSFDDIGGDGIIWVLAADGDFTGEFLILDTIGSNSHDVLEFKQESGLNDNQNSLVVDTDGDIHWANNGMNFDRGLGALSIGTQEVGKEITLSGSNPGIELRDETDTAQTIFSLNSSLGSFWARPNDAANWRRIVAYETAAPSMSLYIDPNGNLGSGTPIPARQLHLVGDNAVFRMDRSTNSAAFMLVRTTGGGAPMKTFVVGTNSSGFNNGEFVINDLGTAVSGGGSRRMTINNSGNVNFPGTVTAANIAAPSSRELKKNIEPIDDPLELTQQLEGVRFDWKANNQAAVGFIAEDLEEVLPEVVLHDEGTGEMLGVNYAAVVPVLVEAIKAQQREMDVQRREIETLKQQRQEVEALEAQIAEQQNLETRVAQLEGLIAGLADERKLALN